MALTLQELQEAVDSVERCGSQTKAAKSLGLNFKTFHSRYRRAIQDGFEPTLSARYNASTETAVDDGDSPIEFPDLPSSEMDVEHLIGQLKERTRRTLRAENAREWMKFKINTQEPFGLVLFGDPHLDNPGTDFELLDRDVQLLKKTPNLWGVCLGDFADQWQGALAAKKAPHQDVTQTQAWMLCDWFLNQKKYDGSSIWLLLIRGNHDMFSDKFGTGDPLKWITQGPAPMEDWRAKFVVEAANGVQVPIHASHDFPGNSLWHKLHGNIRKARLTGHQAAIYISGHRHCWELLESEDPESGRVSFLARARGYKTLDDYAVQLGHERQERGASITAIIDPNQKANKRVRCFPDVEEAADYLNYKRSKV